MKLNLPCSQSKLQNKIHNTAQSCTTKCMTCCTIKFIEIIFLCFGFAKQAKYTINLVNANHFSNLQHNYCELFIALIVGTFYFKFIFCLQKV